MPTVSSQIIKDRGREGYIYIFLNTTYIIQMKFDFERTCIALSSWNKLRDRGPGISVAITGIFGSSDTVTVRHLFQTVACPIRIHKKDVFSYIIMNDSCKCVR